MVYQLTNSATWTAIIYGVNKIPTIFLQPLAGSIIENQNKKRIMIFSDIIRGICVAFIAFSFGIGLLQPWMLLVTSIIISSAEAFRLPSSTSIVPNILSKEVLDFGISLNSSVGSVVELIGLGLVGFIIAQFGIASAIAIDAITFFGSAFIIIFINTHEIKKENVKCQFTGYSELLKEGVKYLLNNKLILNFIILAVLVNAMFVPLNSLLAPLVSEVLKSGEGMLSLISISLSISMLISTISYPYISRKITENKIVLISGISFGLYYLSLVCIGDFIESPKLREILVCGGSFIAGYLISLLSTSINVLFIKNVQPEYIARSAAIMNGAGASAIPIVSFIISIGTTFISTKYNFIIAGILLIFIMFILGIRLNFNPQENTICTELDEDNQQSI